MATLDGFGFAARRNRSTVTNTKIPSKVVSTVLPDASIAFIQPIDHIHKIPTVNSSPSFATFQQKTTTKKSRKSSNSKKSSSTSNTITRYFTTTPPVSLSRLAPASYNNNNMDVDMEEASSNDNDEETENKCVIRKRISIITLWAEIEQDYMQFDDDEHDDYLDKDYEEKTQEQMQVQRMLNISNTNTHNSSSNRGRCKRHIATEEQEEPPSILQLLATTTKRQKRTVDHELSDVMNQFLNLKSRILLPKQQQISLLNDSNSMDEDEDEEEENLIPILRRKMTYKESSLFIFQITQEFLY